MNRIAVLLLSLLVFNENVQAQPYPARSVKIIVPFGAGGSADVYARFSRYRIFAEKKKCISCNVCTSVCHQGIDVMNFANKGMAMEDPQCVRCSACVQQCPTGVLSFGRLGEDGVPILDRLAASPVQMREARH